MPATAKTEPNDFAARRQKIAHDIEESDLPASTKFALRIMQSHGEDELEVNRQGHAETKRAINMQTWAYGGATFVAFILLLFMFAQTKGVDTSKAASDTVKVIDATRGLAEQAPPVAASPPPEE